MANPFKGEASVTLADGRTLRLRRDFNALAEAEAAVGVRMDEITRIIQSGGPVMKFTRALFWGALQAHHPEIALVEAGEILMSDGEAISTAMAGAAAGGEARPEGGKNPPAKRRRGTGTAS